MSAKQGYESPGIAGSGAIATGLAAVSTTTADTILLARSEASAWRAEEKVVAACAKIEGAEPSRLRVTTDPKRPRRLRRRRRGDRRGGRAQGRAARDDRRGLPERRPGDHHLLARHRRDRRGGRHRQALRPARLQPGAADGSWSRSASPTAPRRPARRRWPGARRSARPRSRSPTRPASSSTGCSSPTSSTRCG